MLVVIAADGGRQGMSQVIVQIVVAHDISRSCSGDIDAIAIGQQLHRMANIVVFQQIVSRVIILFAIAPIFIGPLIPSASFGNLVMMNGPSAFATYPSASVRIDAAGIVA